MLASDRAARTLRGTDFFCAGSGSGCDDKGKRVYWSLYRDLKI